MGLSRQEYWGGLPFPSPGDLPHPGIKPRSPTLQADTLPSELCLTLETPWTIACQTRLSMGFPRQEYWSGLPFPSPGIFPDPGTEPRSTVLQEDSLPSKPPGKPKNTGVGNLSLLQWIFPTQELNWDFLHSRQISYQLSYWGNFPGNHQLG